MVVVVEGLDGPPQLVTCQCVFAGWAWRGRGQQCRAVASRFVAQATVGRVVARVKVILTEQTESEGLDD